MFSVINKPALKKTIGTISIFLFFCVSNVHAQKLSNLLWTAYNKHVKEQIGKEISLEDYIDSTQSIKVVVKCKVDSLGEVHSAHILIGKNLKVDRWYRICAALEQNLNLKYMYDHYKNTERFELDFANGKYALFIIPYSSDWSSPQ